MAETRSQKEERNKLIVQDRLNGLSMNECAEKYKLTQAAIAYICKNHGVNGVMSNRKAVHSELSNPKFLSETVIAQRIKETWPGFEYASGYCGIDSKAIIRCKKCGSEFSYNMSALRHGKQPACVKCFQAEKQERLEAEKRDKERMRQEMRRELENERAARRFEKTFDRLQIIYCRECGKKFICIGSSRVHCSDECAKKAVWNHKDRRLNKANRIDKDITLQKLFKRDSGVCYICGKKCDMNDFIVTDKAIICGDMYPSIEHVIPISKGGEHSWENVRLAHRKCNILKRDIAPSIFFQHPTPYGPGGGE